MPVDPAGYTPATQTGITGTRNTRAETKRREAPPPRERKRPGTGTEAPQDRCGGDNTHLTVRARRRWAYRMISRCEAPPPKYNSPEWLALAEGDVRKVAAVVIAAESWARDGDNLEENLRAEVEQLQRAHKAAEDAEYVAGIERHREQWKHLRVVRGGTYVPPEPPRDLYDTAAEHMAALRKQELFLQGGAADD